MDNFVYVPALSVAFLSYLLISFAASKKNQLINAYLAVLVAMIMWTGGSFLMRIQFASNMKLWFDLSITGLMGVCATIYTFVQIATRQKIGLLGKLWYVVLGLIAIINAISGIFLKVPKALQIGNNIQYVYEVTIMTYVMYGVAFLCFISVCYNLTKAIKNNVESVQDLRPLLFGVIILLAGHILYFMPFFKGFPIDMLSGIFSAVCLYYMVYKRRLFKLTLLAGREGISFASILITFFIFYVMIDPLEHLLEKMLGSNAMHDSLYISILFVIVLAVIFSFFKFFTNSIFIKKEIKQNEVLNEYLLDVTQSLDIQQVIDITCRKIKEVIDVDTIIIGLLDDKQQSYQLHSDKNYFSYPAISQHSPIFTYLSEVNGCVSYEDFNRSVHVRSLWQKDKDILDKLQIGLMMPLKDKELFGVIFLPQKKKPYSYDETIFISSLANSASIAIKNSKLYDKVYQEAIRDDLTNTYNRKYFYDVLNTNYLDHKSFLSLMYISVDDFRIYNQLYGKQEGDDALKNIAAIIEQTAGQGSILCRIQGKVFALIMPEYNILNARKLGEDICKQVIDINKHEGNNKKVLTVSIGISCIPLNASTVKELCANAEQALYDAKKAGKNCVNVYSLEQYTKPGEQQRNKFDTSVYNEYSGTICALQAAIDAKDHYTFSHSNNVAYYATKLAEGYGLSDEVVEIVREAALLHDIGKIGIPEMVLNKPGRLSSEEYETMKSHVENSVSIIKHLPSLEYVIPAVISHHERWDGNGYPRKLAKEDIPLTGRILCIADCFDAMTSKRCYKQPFPVELALNEISMQANKQFDPQLAELFVTMFKNGQITLQETNLIQNEAKAN
ncbi:MAG: diguanylate cyclase [Erysipelotrichaceae bacterium]|nr:diguanylate cyclase [Erysipelotrichaceae bacterium]MDY5251185.1 diguanylate cyclase [Erysipelotrichaceae bacterium]